MPRASVDRTDTRQRLVDAAAELAHQQGFHRTTLADVAQRSGVPLGNVYYYFKTKEALGEALIERLSTMFTMAREVWESHADPRARLGAFIQSTVENSKVVAERGCSVGTLCTDLRKGDSPLLEHASTLFTNLLKWLESQFRSLGKGPESRDLALHLLSAVQGASLLAQTFKDPRYLLRETRRLKEWVQSV
ncbi:MAG TPA: TetR/AcrR family transcriptional regulator [Planctomycetota bacterium]|nr:TetR/AcrR family transcriptional regulator [Planctomycetota bacterium]